MPAANHLHAQVNSGIGASAGEYVLPQQAQAQGAAAQPSTETTYHLHGSVVNGITNAPIGRALVFSMDRRLATMTDSEGHFNIDVVVPPRANGAPSVRNFEGSISYIGPSAQYGGGNVQLTAQKPGYAMPRTPILLSLDSNLDSRPANISLMPSAGISGQVFAPGTGGAPNVHVTLLLHQVQDGEYTWTQAGSHQTDSHGNFHFSNLRSGEYTVMTDEWAGDQPILPQPQQKAVTREFPPEFLGDTPGIAGATVLHLRFGDNPQVDLHLHAANYYPVAIPVSGQPPNSAVNVRVLDNGGMSGFRLGYNMRTGSVEGSLPNGSYTLLLASYGQQQSSTLVPITIGNAPLVTGAVALAAGGTIAVHIHTQFTGTGETTYAAVSPQGQYSSPPEPFPPLQLFLRPRDMGGSFANSQHLPGTGANELVVQNAQPGRYHVQVTPSRGYVASMTAGGVDLLAHPLTVNPGGTADPIEVTMRDDTGTLTGKVTGAPDGPAQPIYVVLVPTDHASRVTQGFAGLDKTFTINNIAPGSYRVFAAATYRGNIPFRDAEAMHRYDGKGAAMTITAGQTADVTVPMLDSADEESE